MKKPETQNFSRGDLVRRKDGCCEQLEATILNNNMSIKDKNGRFTSGLMKISFNDSPDLKYIYPKEAFKKIKKGDQK